MLNIFFTCWVDYVWEIKLWEEGWPSQNVVTLSYHFIVDVLIILPV